MAKVEMMPKNPTDKQYIETHKYWVMWPFCPVKRKNHSLEDKNLGFLLATKEHAAGKMTIYHGYMFAAPFTKEQLETMPKTEYENVDEMLTDGWIVD